MVVRKLFAAALFGVACCLTSYAGAEPLAPPAKSTPAKGKPHKPGTHKPAPGKTPPTAPTTPKAPATPATTPPQ